MIAAQAARAAHLRAEERHQREEAKRSRLTLEDGDDSRQNEEPPYVPVPEYYIAKPLKDNDCEENDPSTFLIVANKFGKQCVYRFHASRSLYIFSPGNRIRRFVLFLITHQLFELVILLTILTNCVFLAMSDPPDEAEYVFAAIYTIEMILKIIGRGFALHKYAYLRNAWNWLDFLVVVLGYVTMIPPFDKLSGIRTFRVLRALRTISAVKGLKAMVNTLLNSIKMLSDVLILTIFFLCVFALIGLQLFVGIMGQKCVKTGFSGDSSQWTDYITNKSNWFHFNDVPVICGNDSTAYQCPTNYTCLQNTGDNPVSKFISYDNFGWALLTSLQLVTMDYWESIYNSVIAAKGPWYIFYFLFVIFFGPFYLINLVLAVVSLSYETETAALQDEVLKAQAFAKLKRSASTYSFDGKTTPVPLYDRDVVNPEDLPTYDEPSRVEITQEQEEESGGIEEREPTAFDNFQNGMRAVVNHSVFETFITLCILFNTLAMALEHYDMDQQFSKVLEYFNLFFTGVFILEMVMKLAAFGLKAYCKNKWNLFDGTIVILSVVDMALTYTKTIEGAGLSVLRTFRLLRVLKLAQSWKTMGDLLNTIGSSVGAVGNITVILGIIVYMFAVIGMQVFKQSYDDNPGLFPGGKIPRWNFSNFGHSFMMVFRILCGKWIEPLWDTMTVTSAIAIVFILPAFVIGNFVILNLFLALLLNSFGGEELTPEQEAELERKKQEKKEKKEQRKREKQEKLWGKIMRRKNMSGSRSKVEPEGEEGEEREGMDTNEEPCEKKDAALGLNPANGDVITKQPSYEMNKLHNGQTCDNAYNHKYDETPGKPVGYNTKVYSVPPENRYSLTSARDLDEAAQRIRETTEANKPGLRERIKSDDGLDGSENNLNNGDLVNGSAPVANGNSRVSAGSERSHKDLSIGDIDSRITSGSPGCRDLERRDTVVTVSGERRENRIRPCCPSFCYCGCCHTYKESCVRRKWHAMRQKVCDFVEHKYFESFILFMIVISSLTLAVEDVNLPTRPTLKSGLEVLNYVFTVTFCLEFLLKLFGFGVVGYFSNLWNCLDFFIVAISLASITGNENLNAFRSLRALRPLRAISRFEGMKIVVNSLVHAVPAIVNVMLVCLVFWLIFSIVGYQLFGGKFYKCVDSTTLEVYNHEVVPNKTMCNETAGMRWVNSKINFDSSIQGFLALFQVATLEGVFEVMQDSADSVNIKMQPIYEHSFYANFYYVVFIILGSFFILNLFIGVIIENFNKLKQQYEDEGALGFLLTPSQRNWVNAIKKTYSRRPKKQPKKPTNPVRRWLFDLIALRKFEIFIMSVIMVNMLTMMMEHHNQSPDFTDALKYLNYIFTGIFIVEACIRLIALRLDYFKQGWNVFDFTIVVFSIVGIIVEDVLKQEMIFSPGLLRVVRCFRLGRLLRFFEGAKGIRQLLFALVKSVPGLANIAMLLGLIIFIYAIIGMSSFGYVKKTNGITEVVNFETFGSSMLLLFRIGTAAGWNAILDPLMIQPPDCDMNYTRPYNAGKGNCGIPYLAVPYFVSYILVVFLIVINMYIAVILENFNEAQQQEEIGLTDDDLETFVQVWEELDEGATLYIRIDQLPEFLKKLEPPLQIDTDETPIWTLYTELKIPLTADNRVYIFDLMQILVRRVVGQVDDLDEDMIMSLLEGKFKKDGTEPTVTSSAELFYKYSLAAMCIQRAVRKFLINKTMREHHNNKFHRYNQGGNGKDDSWNEKTFQGDDGGGDKQMGKVIANMWLNQARHIEDQLTSGISGISGSDTEGEDMFRSAPVPTVVVSSDNEARGHYEKVTNC